MNKEPIIRTATFNPRVCSYWLWSPVIIFCLTIVLIPLLFIWVPLALILVKRYLARMSCVLTERNLLVRKGMLVRVEKSIPLEKITDLGLVQGPIMRHFGVHQLTVETAGQSAAGALVSLTGIEDVEDFREAVLAQRDQRRDVGQELAPKDNNAQAVTAGVEGILADIHSTLLRIEESLTKKN